MKGLGLVLEMPMTMGETASLLTTVAAAVAGPFIAYRLRPPTCMASAEAPAKKHTTYAQHLRDRTLFQAGGDFLPQSFSTNKYAFQSSLSTRSFNHNKTQVSVELLLHERASQFGNVVHVMFMLLNTFQIELYLNLDDDKMLWCNYNFNHSRFQEQAVSEQNIHAI